MSNYLIMPLTITRGEVFEDYVFIPSALDASTGQDLTSYEFQAEVRDKPNGTLLATLTCTKNVAPPGYSGNGWVQIYLDDAVVIPAGYWRGTWALLAGIDGENPVRVAAGPVEIMPSITGWV